MTALALLTNRWVLGAIGLALLLAFAGVQTARLSHAKHDLAAARVALVNPATRHTWQVDYTATARALGTCHGSLGNISTALGTQTAAVAVQGLRSAVALGTATQAVQRAEAGRLAAERRQVVLSRPLTAATACARMDEADVRAREALR